MKKILLVALFFAAISCTHQNQKITLDLPLNEKKLAIQSTNTVTVTVIDDRKNKDIIGTKKFGDEKIEISSEQNLPEFLREKIAQNLATKGFAAGKDKNVEFHIETFKYKAKRKFFIGRSEAESNIRVTIIDNKTGTKFTKKYSLDLTRKHFIAPLEVTDEETINKLLQESFSDILNDSDLLKSLAQ